MCDCLYFLRYWTICVLHLFVSHVRKFKINLIFLIKSFFYMTKKSRRKLKYLENKKKECTICYILNLTNLSWYLHLYTSAHDFILGFGVTFLGYYKVKSYHTLWSVFCLSNYYEIFLHFCIIQKVFKIGAHFLHHISTL